MNAMTRIRTPMTRRLANPGTLAVLALVGLAHLALWWGLNRPVPLPDFTGPVAGLAFAPYQRGQSAETGTGPSAEQITSDLRHIAPMTRRIRTYGVEGTLGQIPTLAQGLDLRVTLGAWLDTRPDHNAAEIRRLVTIARANRNVDRVLVGNEAVLRRDQTPAQIIAAMASVRAQIRQPVSTAEPWHVWLDHPELGQAADFITIHLLPYWEGLSAEDANRFIMEKLDAVRARFPGKQVVIGEVGWPSDGRDIRDARASIVNQAAFLRRFFIEAQDRRLDYFVMEAFDQPWKTAFEGRAAGYWGMFDLDRQPKWPLTGAVSETPGWAPWAAGSTLLASLLGGLFLSRRPDIRLTGKVLFAALVQAFITSIAVVLLAMSDTYLSWSAAAVWLALIAGQGLLLLLLVGDSFELAETVFGTRWTRRFPALPAPAGTRQPKVSLHIAICNEPPEMVAQTLNALAALDYANFEVLVIDNNTTDPRLWEPVERHCLRLGQKFRFFHLGKYPGFKAGALNFGLRQTAPDAEIIGVLDSDYLANPDWLARMVPFFQNPEVGFTQSPQDYRDGSESAFKRMMFWEYAGFFRAGMVTRNERDAIIQHGTMTLIRAAALRDAKGWAEWTICEDSELGLRLMRAGWKAVYVPDSMGRGVMPDDFAAYRKQRFRWAQGAVQIVKGHAGALFNPFNRDLTRGQRWHFVMGWMPWFGDALGLAFVAGSLAWSAGLIFAPVRTDFPILLFMLPSLGLFAFKLVQLWMLYAARVECGAWDRLGAALGGLSLTHTIGKAVWMGLIHRRATFFRTPKMADAPALVQGLVMVREELGILALLWAAILGVTLVHGGATWEAALWTVVLGVQSIPYLAAVGVSLLAVMPAKTKAVPVAHPARAFGRAREIA
ncbi:glycosyltransferase [Humitalea sp. 24SJ18S-53]|uniref:glycosyltransferase n=1 Tax=Humitalea sp. 24SJ18S-53 TaxID=3422307 RepID=UPI003D67DCCC